MYPRVEKREKNTRRDAQAAVGKFLLVSLLVVTMVPLPGIVRGQEGTPAAELLAAPAEVQAIPTDPPPPPTAVPTSPPPPPSAVPVPPTAVPPTAIPTQVSPTEVPLTAIPTEVPPTETPEPTATMAPTPTQTPTPTPTERVWENTDAMRLTDGVTTFTLNQGETATFSITYDVTTPRTSTTIHAELIGAVDGWTLASTEHPDADPSASRATWTQASTREPGSSFLMKVTVTAPETLSADHSIGIRVWSTAEGLVGEEIGVAWSHTRFATVSVVALPPSSAPTVEPTASPTDDPDATRPDDQAVEPTIEPGTSPTPDPEVEVTSTPDLQPTGDAVPTASPTASIPEAASYLREQVETAVEQADVPAALGIPTTGISCEPQDMGVDGSAVAIEPGGAAGFACTLTGEPAKVSWHSGATPGWSVTVDGAMTSPVTIGNHGKPFTVLLTPSECSTNPVARVTLSIYSPNGEIETDQALDTVTLTVQCQQIAIAEAPDVQIQPFAFEPLMWKGSWGTTTGIAGITVHRDGPGSVGSYVIQVGIVDASHDGLNPAIVDASSNGTGLSTAGLAFGPGRETATVATVSPEFHDTGTVDVHIALSPDNDVPAGSYTVTVSVTVVNGQ